MPRLNTEAFQAVMQQLARAWSEQNTHMALDCFTEDAVYIEPPDIQFYQGHEQLRPYFAALQPGTSMQFHHLWFDEQNQTGAGEYSFGMQDQATADHGVVVVELRDGRIAFWREYQRQGPPAFKDFTATDGKSWRWHSGNYPAAD